MALDFNERMKLLFGPWAAAAGRPDLTDQLKTAPLPKERKNDQFERLKLLRSADVSAMPLSGRAFVFRYEDETSRILAVDIDELNASDRESLSGWAAQYGLTSIEMEEADFIFLTSELSGIFTPKARYLVPSEASNVLDVVGDGYAGHSIYDIIGYFRQLSLFRIDGDSSLFSCSAYALAAKAAIAVAAFRSQTPSPEAVSALSKIETLPNVNPENIYYALMATQWRYVVLETYKCLEPAFFLPWIAILRDALGVSTPAYEMVNSCRSSLQWREKEKESIRALFTLISDLETIAEDALKLDCFKELDADTATAKAIGARVYRIRNELVHGADYEHPERLVISDTEWSVLSVFISNVVFYVFSTYSADLGFTFDPESKDKLLAAA